MTPFFSARCGTPTVIGLVSLLLSACGGGGGTATTISISPETWDATRLGQRQQLTATVTDANGNTSTNAGIRWTSSNSAVAEVDSNGLVTAHAPGTAEITARANNASDTMPLTVSSAVPSDVGDMYTAWSARSEDSPVLLVNGTLAVVADIYCRDLVYGIGLNPPVLSYTSIVCPVPMPAGVDDGFKFPAPTRPWSQGGVEKFQWAGDRLGILSDMANGAGTFRVVDRHEEWTILALANAVDFQMAGDFIAVLLNDGRLRVKTGIHGPWTTLDQADIARIQLVKRGSTVRIGELYRNGTFRVKEGINSPWTTLESNAVAFQLAGNRIATQREDGVFRVKDGIHGGWTVLESNGVLQFQLAGDYIAVLRPDGIFRVKQGIHGGWTILGTEGLQKFQLESNAGVIRIAELRHDGVLRAKDGVDGLWWTLASSGVQDIQLQEDFIGLLNSEGALLIKKGITGEWRSTPAYGAGTVSQFRVVADVPSPANRTTIDSYRQKQRECSEQRGNPSDPNMEIPCIAPIVDAFPADLYGRFCGQDIPRADIFWDVFAAGPIDGLDFLCQNHDRSRGWYPSETVSAYEECIVRYGLDHARVTRDGALLSGSGENLVLNRMPYLRDAISHYKDDVGSTGNGNRRCTDNELTDFTANTAARHNLD